MVVEADKIGLGDFLQTYPNMRIRPGPGPGLVLTGMFEFTAEHVEFGRISDTFSLEFRVPPSFPRGIPEVLESEGKIPLSGKFHLNGNGSLCMGSPLRLLTLINKEPTLVGFAANCLVPYLFAISKKLKEGGNLAFGELAHFTPGMLQDYAEILSLETETQAKQALRLLATRRRVANKRWCPCGCKRRLARCNFRHKLDTYRCLAKRSWFREHFDRDIRD